MVIDMIRRTTAVAFRQNLGEMLNIVQYRGDSVLTLQMQGRFEDLCGRLERGFAVVDEDEGLAEIDAAVAAERRGPRT